MYVYNYCIGGLAHNVLHNLMLDALDLLCSHFDLC